MILVKSGSERKFTAAWAPTFAHINSPLYLIGDDPIGEPTNNSLPSLSQWQSKASFQNTELYHQQPIRTTHLQIIAISFS